MNRNLNKIQLGAENFLRHGGLTIEKYPFELTLFYVLSRHEVSIGTSSGAQFFNSIESLSLYRQ